MKYKNFIFLRIFLEKIKNEEKYHYKIEIFFNTEYIPLQIMITVN